MIMKDCERIHFLISIIRRFKIVIFQNIHLLKNTFLFYNQNIFHNIVQILVCLLGEYNIKPGIQPTEIIRHQRDDRDIRRAALLDWNITFGTAKFSAVINYYVNYWYCNNDKTFAHKKQSEKLHYFLFFLNSSSLLILVLYTDLLVIFLFFLLLLQYTYLETNKQLLWIDRWLGLKKD